MHYKYSIIWHNKFARFSYVIRNVIHREQLAAAAAEKYERCRELRVDTMTGVTTANDPLRQAASRRCQRQQQSTVTSQLSASFSARPSRGLTSRWRHRDTDDDDYNYDDDSNEVGLNAIPSYRRVIAHRRIWTNEAHWSALAHASVVHLDFRIRQT